MSNTHDNAQPSPSPSVLQAAAEWYALLSSGSASQTDHADWRKWLERHPAHGVAWQKVEAVSRQFHPVLRNPAQRAASAAGLDAAAQRRRGRRTLIKTLALLGSTGTLALGGTQTGPGRRLLAGVRADHATPVGGFQALTLDDGTQLWLDTDTAVKVDYGAEVRRLTLLRGEILISTAPDAGRPFVVVTGQGRLQALGTRFTVATAPGETRLAVFEGKVRARFAGHDAGPLDVDAGLQVRADRNGISALQAARPQAASWARRILQVEEAPLSTVVTQLARYRKGYLGCAPAIAHLTVTGTFPLDDIGRALRMLTAMLPVRVHHPLPWWTSLQAN